ncbi:MAG: hypothetical protein JNL84_09310, partial [Candidatus Accumulibacter sp.]|nr:hypothetical protein [Accumulibacter sp.]
LRSLLQHQAVDGAFSIFHKIEKISSPSWRQARYQEVHQSDLLALLWRNAQSWQQRRRIARHALKTLLSK